jgi:hypothetical protein
VYERYLNRRLQPPLRSAYRDPHILGLRHSCSRFIVPVWVRRSLPISICHLDVYVPSPPAHANTDLRTDAFDGSSDFPFPSPTAPAPGPSLLDDDESKYLDSFFHGVSSDLNYDFFTNQPDGSELGLGWNEMPPTFMGTTTSFGQQPQLGSHGLPTMNYSNDMNSHMNNPPAIPSSTSADLLAAATLLQTAPNARAQSISNEALFRGHDLTLPPTNGQVRTQSISHYPQPRSNPATQDPPPRNDFMRDNFYTDMMFGSQSEASIRPRQLSQTHLKADIRWGSDAGFGSAEGFVPPVSQKKEVTAIDTFLKVIEGALVETPSSADSTRPSTPTHPNTQISPMKPRFSGNIKYDEEQDSRPRKRRKSKFQEDEEEDDPPTSATKQSKTKRKSIKRNDSPVPEQSSKRRKSAAAANASAKAARENLTEDQKRENHIRSEQKRRTLIREGFEDLSELVPGLRGGGFSKSAVLIMSADWLEELMQGNEVLRQRLAQMQGR